VILARDGEEDQLTDEMRRHGFLLDNDLRASAGGGGSGANAGKSVNAGTVTRSRTRTDRRRSSGASSSNSSASSHPSRSPCASTMTRGVYGLLLLVLAVGSGLGAVFLGWWLLLWSLGHAQYHLILPQVSDRIPLVMGDGTTPGWQPPLAPGALFPGSPGSWAESLEHPLWELVPRPFTCQPLRPRVLCSIVNSTSPLGVLREQIAAFPPGNWSVSYCHPSGWARLTINHVEYPHAWPCVTAPSIEQCQAIWAGSVTAAGAGSLLLLLACAAVVQSAAAKRCGCGCERARRAQAARGVPLVGGIN